jgi:hypothetical protein
MLFVEGVGDRLFEVQRGPFAEGGVPGVGAPARSCGFEEGRVEPGIDRVLRLAVAVCCGSAGEPRGAVEVVADCDDCGEAGYALAGGG